MNKPFDPDLNAAVLELARTKFPQGYDVAPNAPETADELFAVLDAGKRMTVFSGASDNTIFGPAFVNWAFRAWHDWHHWQGQFPFTPEGERKACEAQCAELRAVYGDNAMTAQWCKLLDCEINGQLAYAEKHEGSFPVNQRSFTAAYLANPERAVKATF